MGKIKTHLSPHYNERPEGCEIDTLVVHSMYAREADPQTDPLACVKVLDECKVSAHYLVTREGAAWNMVPVEKRAWHAGLSKLPFPDDPRENVNNFSIGVELVESVGKPFTKKQYQALARLTERLASRLPLATIVGHEHIAPDRKTDPGALFDWNYYRSLLKSARKRFRFAE